MADASFEQVQVEAMELLLQQVVAPQEQTLAQGTLSSRLLPSDRIAGEKTHVAFY